MKIFLHPWKKSHHNNFLKKGHVLHICMVLFIVQYLQQIFVNAFPKFSDNWTNHNDTMVERSGQSWQSWTPSMAIMTSSTMSQNDVKHCLPIHSKAVPHVVATVHEIWEASSLWYLGSSFNPNFLVNHAICMQELNSIFSELARDSVINTMYCVGTLLNRHLKEMIVAKLGTWIAGKCTNLYDLWLFVALLFLIMTIVM